MFKLKYKEINNLLNRPYYSVLVTFHNYTSSTEFLYKPYYNINEEKDLINLLTKLELLTTYFYNFNLAHQEIQKELKLDNETYSIDNFINEFVEELNLIKSDYEIIDYEITYYSKYGVDYKVIIEKDEAK